MLDKANNTKAPSPKRKIERWEIGWLVLLVLGPAVFLGPYVALFFVVYLTVPEVWLFLVLAILGIILYALCVYLLFRIWFKAKDPNYASGPVDTTAADLSFGPRLNAGIIGFALYHGLFGGRMKANSDSAWDDLLWQEKYRHHDY